MADAPIAPSIILRAGCVGVGLGLWFLTQSLLRYRPDGTGVLGDGLHALTDAKLFGFHFRSIRFAKFSGKMIWIDVAALGSSGFG